MKYYTSLTEYNAGVDLHSRNLYLCLMDRAGRIKVHENIRGNDLDRLRQLIEPYRHDPSLAPTRCPLAPISNRQAARFVWDAFRDVPMCFWCFRAIPGRRAARAP